MNNLSLFELHTFSPRACEPAGELLSFADLVWQEDARPAADVLTIPAEQQAEDATFWVGLEHNGSCVEQVEHEADAVAGFRVVNRRLGDALAMIKVDNRVRVNGLPALSFSVLSPRDGLVLAPTLHTYVTQRIRPFVGPATKEIAGTKCPFCRIPIEEGAPVISCRCGVSYHAETVESHPDVAAEDRLNCNQKVRVCLSCGRPLTSKETLVWDPATY